jgi:hypothetical protein
MYPVPRHSKTVITEWADDLASRFGCSAQVVQGQSVQWLSFPSETVRIELMDESCIEFKYSFHLVNEGKRSIAVFTEHCGHHVFPYHEARVFVNGALVYEQGGS